MRYIVAASAALWLYAPAPADPKGPAPTDPKTLNLKIDSLGSYKHGQQQDYFEIMLFNGIEKVREVPELPAWGNRLTQCVPITYVIRFENGLTLELENGRNRTHAPGTVLKRVPLALPSGGYVAEESRLFFLFGHHHEFADNTAKGQPFTVTAICRALKLKSNTLYINKYPVPPKGKEHDPFKDADDYQVRSRRPVAPPPKPKDLIP